jgi:hypothetical protein
MAYDTPYVQKPDSGSLKKNATKLKPTSPDYWGDIHINLKDLTNIDVVNGLTVVRFNGWKNVDSNGQTYLSLSVKRIVAAPSAPRPKPADDFPDEDIPF